MSSIQRGRKLITGLILALVLVVTSACTNVAERPTAPSTGMGSLAYEQLERGNTPASQNFGDWVAQTAKGLVSDAFVRDNDKLGVVITPQVRPNDVRPLAKALAQGFHRNFPNHDLTVLMYAPDKTLIMTARYKDQSKQIEYQGA